MGKTFAEAVFDTVTASSVAYYSLKGGYVSWGGPPHNMAEDGIPLPIVLTIQNDTKGRFEIFTYSDGSLLQLSASSGQITAGAADLSIHRVH